MTEDEASETRCIGPRPENTGFAVINTDDAEGEPRVVYYCRASDCQAGWRWKEAKRTEAFTVALVEHMKATGQSYNKALQEVLKRRSEFAYTDGFCGLAGGPSEGTHVP